MSDPLSTQAEKVWSCLIEVESNALILILKRVPTRRRQSPRHGGHGHVEAPEPQLSPIGGDDT